MEVSFKRLHHDGYHELATCIFSALFCDEPATCHSHGLTLFAQHVCARVNSNSVPEGMAPGQGRMLLVRELHFLRGGSRRCKHRPQKNKKMGTRNSGVWELERHPFAKDSRHCCQLCSRGHGPKPRQEVQGGCGKGKLLRCKSRFRGQFIGKRSESCP